MPEHTKIAAERSISMLRLSAQATLSRGLIGLNGLEHSPSLRDVRYNGLVAGGSLDRIRVQLPAFRRVGARPWADFSRQADLKNGIFWYPLLAIGGTALGIAAAMRSTIEETSPWTSRVGPLARVFS